MMKRHLLMMATVLSVLGALVAIKSFIPATGAAPESAPGPALPTAMAPPETRKIVAAPAIDPKAEVFIGTGDGSAGSWVRP